MSMEELRRHAPTNTNTLLLLLVLAGAILHCINTHQEQQERQRWQADSLRQATQQKESIVGPDTQRRHLRCLCTHSPGHKIALLLQAGG